MRLKRKGGQCEPEFVHNTAIYDHFVLYLRRLTPKILAIFPSKQSRIQKTNLILQGEGEKCELEFVHCTAIYDHVAKIEGGALFMMARFSSIKERSLLHPFFLLCFAPQYGRHQGGPA